MGEDKRCPLALRVRPLSLEDFVGQKDLLSPGKLLYRLITARRLPSMIFYGPAGCGKTSLGFIIARMVDAEFCYLNAAFTSTKEIKEFLFSAKKNYDETGQRTIIFIDEIHRFNKLQQESLVPDTEGAEIILIGATIYNPHYYLIPSLVSRAVLVPFKPLTTGEIIKILNNALKKDVVLSKMKRLKVNPSALEYIAKVCSGDARKALNALEVAVLTTPSTDKDEIIISQDVVKECIQKNIFYDKKDGYHYDTTSALIKSIRGSDVDSALYWLAKMLAGGEDPRFIARRLVILASEDIGNANPMALVIANSCFSAVERVGMPEAKIILAQTVCFLSASPKSNAAYLAIKAAEKEVRDAQTKEVPTHLKTHSCQYLYPHDFGGYVPQDYGINKRFYFPKDIGEERKIKAFLEMIRKLRRQRKQNVRD